MRQTQSNTIEKPRRGVGMFDRTTPIGYNFTILKKLPGASRNSVQAQQKVASCSLRHATCALLPVTCDLLPAT